MLKYIKENTSINKNEVIQTRINIQDNYKKGIFFILISSITFALVAVLIKNVEHLPLMEMVFFRSIPTMIIFPIIIKRMNIPLFGNNKPILWFRCFIGVLGILTVFYTFTIMPLTDAMTLLQLHPLFIFFLSGIFLKEKLSLQKIPFFLFAFLGGVLVIKPGLRIDMFPAMIAILAAIFMAITHVTLRHLRLTDHPLVIVNYFAYISAFIGLMTLFLQKNFKVPSISDLFFLTLLGLCAVVTQYTLTRAYQMAPANLISLYAYSQIIFASVFGLLFFKEIPDIFSIIGAGCIIISGYLNYRYKSNN